MWIGFSYLPNQTTKRETPEAAFTRICTKNPKKPFKNMLIEMDDWWNEWMDINFFQFGTFLFRKLAGYMERYKYPTYLCISCFLMGSVEASKNSTISKINNTLMKNKLLEGMSKIAIDSATKIQPFEGQSLKLLFLLF